MAYVNISSLLLVTQFQYNRNNNNYNGKTMEPNATYNASFNGTRSNDIQDYPNPFDVIHIRIIFTILYGLVFLAAFVGKSLNLL